MNRNHCRKKLAALTLATLNDRIRQAWGVYPNSKVFVTAGIAALPLIEQLEISGKVQKYDHFCEDNDPYGEHDFGAFDHHGQCIFWKIDYYDLEMCGASPEPTDTSKTVRVLTIMLADEW